MNKPGILAGFTGRLCLQALFAIMLMLSACENGLDKINEISAKESASPVEETTGVDIIYSDSAKVKLQLLAPLLLRHQNLKDPSKDYDLMPKGVKVIFYDTAHSQTGTIIADTGISRSTNISSSAGKLIEFHKNVVATNAQGETFKSDELIWDQNKKIIYSNKPVVMTGNGGNVMNGINFTSDEKLTHQVFGSATGVMHVSDLPGNQ